MHQQVGARFGGQLLYLVDAGLNSVCCAGGREAVAVVVRTNHVDYKAGVEGGHSFHVDACDGIIQVVFRDGPADTAVVNVNTGGCARRPCQFQPDYGSF